MSQEALLTLAAGTLLVTTLAAVGSNVFHELSWHELEEHCRRRKRRELFDDVHDHADAASVAADILQLLGAVLLIVVSYSWFWLHRSADQPSWTGTGLVVLGLALTLIVLLVWIPRAVAELWSAEFVLHTWSIWRALTVICRPLSWGIPLATGLLRRLGGHDEQPDEEEAFEDEIRAIVTEGHHDGLLEADARDMIKGVMELDDTDVADIMTPRSKIDAMPVDLDWPELLERVIRCGRTRIPIYEGKLDNIIGILYVKDLMPELARPDATTRRNVREILRQPWSVPKTRRLDDLLQDFLQTRNHMALVVDEYMAVAGLATIEDVLEEIVGEIVDESDQENLEEIKVVSETTAEIHGRAHLSEINEKLGLELPEPDDLETIGGFVISHLGRIPQDGESFTWNNLRITVQAASRRRVERVRLQMLDGSTSIDIRSTTAR